MAGIEHVFTARAAPVGDFEVQRVLPQRERRFVGPFCFLDHFGPHTAVGNARSGVGPHPHIGLSTVTYLFEGAALHRDSLGTEQLIVPGDVNWMTAGRGIVHSERTPEPHWGKPLTLHGLQVWVGLPRALEENPPSFQHASKSQLPSIIDAGVIGSVVLGEWSGQASPIRLSSESLYAVLELEADGEVLAPKHLAERAVYVVEGTACVDGEVVEAHHLAVLRAGAEVRVSAPHRAKVAVLAGEPLDGPRFMWWNFVSSRRERLEQAKDDWRHGRFALIPQDAADRIPMPGE